MSNPFEQAPPVENNEFFLQSHFEAISTFEQQNPYRELDGNAFLVALEELS